MKKRYICMALALCAGVLSAEAQTVIADFGADFTPSLNGAGSAYVGTELPATGWAYQYSTNGIGSANYVDMVPSTTATPETWVTPGGNPANMKISHGAGTWQAGTGLNLRSIAAYEIQPGEAGAIALVNSQLSAGAGAADLDFLVYVNDRFVRRVEARGPTTTDFDCPLGNLVAGDVVYVIMDGREVAFGDLTTVDYQLVKDDPQMVYYVTASATNAYYNDSVTFDWGIALDADSMTVSPSIGGTTDLLVLTTNGVGTIDATVISNITYTISVQRGVETSNSVFDIVLVPLTIHSFFANPPSAYAGDEVELSWDVGGAESIVISNATGTVLSTNVAVGSIILTPPQGTNTYTLTASNSGGEVQTSDPVEVVIAASIPVGLIVDAAFENNGYNSNGSFEYDSAGNVITVNPANNVVGKWQSGTFTLGTQEFRIDSTRVTTGFATDGTHSLQISQPGVIGAYSGGYLNTGYVVSEFDTGLTLNFDWNINNTQAGQTYASAALFTSSDNTLTGTLTEIAKLTFGGASQATPITETIATNFPAASVGKELFIAFARESNVNAAGQRINIDSVNLIVDSDPPATQALLSIGYDAGQLSVTASNLAVIGVVNTLQGSVSLSPPSWTDIASTSGVTEATWVVGEAESTRLFRVESNK